MRSLNCPISVANLSLHVAETVATKALMKAAVAKRRGSGMPVRIAADGSLWRWVAASELAADESEALVVAADDAPAAGRYIRDLGPAVLELPFTFAKADAAVLLTIPTGFVIQPEEFMWKVTTGFTGGSSSAIGVSSTKTGFTTKGDLLGGAGGDVAAALTTVLSPTLGTIGAGFDTLAKRRVLWKATEIIRFDRITSVFTAGVGAVLMRCNILATPAVA